ncbi:MAG: alpha/beta hydrolase [Lachnospiraceae bacterium]
MHSEKIILNEERNVSLTVYLQEVGGEFQHVKKRPSVLILPGGGYQMCSDREADPVAVGYLKAGYHVFILRYSVKEEAAWPNPLSDYEQAMELIRSNEDTWNLYADKIAVVGFSAGGHLAGCAATMSKNRPNAAILGYAVLNEEVKMCNPSAPEVISKVSYDTCPCFIFASRTDSVVSVANSVQFMNALIEHDVSFESHIYAYGPHGFSTGDTSVQSRDTDMCSRIENWVGDSVGWLRDILGDFGSDGMTKPACKGHVKDDGADFLSVDCTMAVLMKNEAAHVIINPILNSMQQAIAGDAGVNATDEAVLSVIAKLKLRDLLFHVGVETEDVERMNEQLLQIPNK